MITLATLVLLVGAVSLLVHELGHYAAGRALGYRCRFGWASWGPCVRVGVDLERIGQRDALLVALAGPFATLGLLLLGLVLPVDVQWRGLVLLVQLDMLLLACPIDYWHALRAGWRMSHAEA